MSGICIETTKILYYGYNKDTGQMINQKSSVSNARKEVCQYLCVKNERANQNMKRKVRNIKHVMVFSVV